jgi:ATP-dependent protease ClpP protease subunit
MHVYIYNEIGFWGTTAESVQKQIADNPKDNTITVHLSSPGGEVFEGWTIGNLLKNSDKRVVVNIEGLCASIATYIALQADEINMAETARFMIHNPSIMIEGDQRDLEAASAQLETIKADLVKSYKKKTGLEDVELSAMMDNETWMNADEARAKGFIDNIMEPVKAVAKLNLKHIQMSEIKEEVKEEKQELSKLDQITNRMSKFLDDLGGAIGVKNEGEVTNEVVELSDGVKIFVVSEDGELVGKEAFIADEEGNRTDEIAPAGTHELIDGRSIVISDEGIVEAIEEMEAPAEAEVDEEKEALKNKVAELEAQLKASNEASTTVTNQMEELKGLTLTMKSELDAIKNTAVGEEPVIANGYTKPENKSTAAKEPASSMDKFAKQLKSL